MRSHATQGLSKAARSPLTPNTKHCDDCTENDRASHQISNQCLRYNQGKTHD
ncbi:hypothetical protein QUA81_26960 [Microcoleus sp. F6_B4]